MFFPEREEYASMEQTARKNGKQRKTSSLNPTDGKDGSQQRFACDVAMSSRHKNCEAEKGRHIIRCLLRELPENCCLLLSF
jgi:hypothetical protein